MLELSTMGQGLWLDLVFKDWVCPGGFYNESCEEVTDGGTEIVILLERGDRADGVSGIPEVSSAWGVLPADDIELWELVRKEGMDGDSLGDILGKVSWGDID